MKKHLLVTLISIGFFGADVFAQEKGNSNPSGIWVEQAAKSNKKFIRNFDAGKKAAHDNWMAQTDAIDIRKGIYRIRFTNTGALLADKVVIRKVEQSGNQSAETRILLPTSYYRVEHPAKDIVEIYFSAGANRFFADMPGYLMISGLLQKNNQAMPDMAIGVNHYLAVTEKKKGKISTLLAVR